MKLRFVALAIAFSIITLLFIPLAQAQSKLKITIKPLSEVVFDQTTIVSVSITDEAGKGLADQKPLFSFSPTKFVEDIDDFDCGDPKESTSCDPDHKGVVGDFEIHLVMVDSPATLTVTVGTEKQQLVLTASDAPAVKKPSTPTVTESEAPAEIITPKTEVVKTAIAAKDIAVGPTPSILFFLLPLLIIGVVVSVFVSTVKD